MTYEPLIEKIVLSARGSARREVLLSEIQVPDLWEIATRKLNPTDRKAVLETWHLAHDLLDNLRGNIPS
jgi:hypothetical protein